MEPLENVVLRRENFVERADIDEANALHAAFGIDANFALGMGILMLSILQNNPKLPVVFHVFTSGLHPEDMERIKETVRPYPAAVKLYYMNLDAFKHLPTKVVLPPANYFRFVVADALYGLAEQVLYLDSDVLCTGPLDELTRLSLGSNVVGAVDDLPGMAEDAIARSFGFAGERYFNAGILYINVRAWKEGGFAWRAIELLSQKNHFKYLSQDVLNLLFTDRVTWLKHKYNLVYNLFFMKDSIPADTALIHYAGRAKPWQRWGVQHPAAALYLRYKDQSPWRDVPIQEPTTYKHAKFMGRTCRQHGRYGKALCWYSLYGIRKIMKKLTD